MYLLAKAEEGRREEGSPADDSREESGQAGSQRGFIRLWQAMTVCRSSYECYTV